MHFRIYQSQEVRFIPFIMAAAAAVSALATTGHLIATLIDRRDNGLVVQVYEAKEVNEGFLLFNNFFLI